MLTLELLFVENVLVVAQLAEMSNIGNEIFRTYLTVN